jgi:hypothetical protein
MPVEPERQDLWLPDVCTILSVFLYFSSNCDRLSKDPRVFNANQNLDVGESTGIVPPMNDQIQTQSVTPRALVCIHVLIFYTWLKYSSSGIRGMLITHLCTTQQALIRLKSSTTRLRKVLDVLQDAISTIQARLLTQFALNRVPLVDFKSSS